MDMLAVKRPSENCSTNCRHVSAPKTTLFIRKILKHRWSCVFAEEKSLSAPHRQHHASALLPFFPATPSSPWLCTAAKLSSENAVCSG